MSSSSPVVAKHSIGSIHTAQQPRPVLSDRAPAIVVGLCAHGLTLVRSLEAAGVAVIALEANRSLPGVRTRFGQIRFVEDINGPGLVRDLIRLGPSLQALGKPVLFLTNDKMVATIGASIDEVRPFYRLSWADAADRLLPLLRKDRIEEQCHETRLPYPKTRLFETIQSLAGVTSGLRFPVIVKPTAPVSAFKTIVASTIDELESNRDRISQALPVIVQEFIPGDDRSIRFGALYLDRGNVVARFEGRKLRSWPMGHTTIAISAPDDAIHRLAVQFFRGLNLSGPVSLELKRDPQGVDWVIEPTVGRTDFWTGLCIANGIDLPGIEYLCETGRAPAIAAQRTNTVWINGERDPGAVVWLATHEPRILFSSRIRGVYASWADSAPFFAALSQFLGGLPRRIVRKVSRIVRAR